MSRTPPNDPDCMTDQVKPERGHEKDLSTPKPDKPLKGAESKARPEGIPAPKVFKYPLRPPKVG